MDNILIVEDDNDLSNLVKDYLQIEGFNCIITENGEEGIEKLNHQKIDLIIMDIMMPKLDGITACKKIRENTHIPIIMLSAKSGDMDKILSLGVGADDYMTKPFSPMELVARVKAHLRRQTYFNSNSNKEKSKTFGKLKIYPDSYKVTIEGSEIKLTTREFQILNYFTENKGRVFTKEQLYEGVWGYNEYMDENTIAVYVKRLREKLGDEGKLHLKTVWGVGYKWEE